MKILAHPIDVIFLVSKDGIITPQKFKYLNPQKLNKEKTHLVDVILDTRESNMAGEKARIFTCESTIDDKRIKFELRYTLSNGIWVLYKILK